MAAPTTSLPETPGGARNWTTASPGSDSAFMLRSLYHLGFDWEAIEYWALMIDAVSGGDLNHKLELQIMYRIGGDATWLSGRSTTCPGTGGRGRSGSATVPGISISMTSGMIMDALDVQFRHGAAQIVEPVWDGRSGFVDAALQHGTSPTRASGSARRPEALHRIQDDAPGRGLGAAPTWPW